MNETAPDNSQRGVMLWRLLLPAALCAALLAATLLLYRQVRDREVLAMLDSAQQEGFVLAGRLQQRIERELRAVRRLRLDWIAGRIRGTDELYRLASAEMRDRPACRLLAGADEQNTCVWVTPLVGNEAMLHRDLSLDAHWAPLIARARQSGREAMAQPGDQAAGTSLIGLVVPMSSPSDSEAGGTPLLLAQLDAGVLFNEVLDDRLRRDFDIALYDGPHLLAWIGRPLAASERRYDRQTVTFSGRTLELRLWPGDRSVAGRMAGSGRLVLWMGLPAVVLLPLVLWRMITQREREREIQVRRHVAALESLNRIFTALCASLGSGQRVLELLAESARQLLNMSRAGIALVEEEGRSLRIAVFAGPIPPGARTRFLTRELVVTQRCLQSGECYFQEDCRSDPLLRSSPIVAEFDAGCFVLIPLQVEGRSIGVLALSSSQPRRFTDSERHLARLLASQASVIVANNRLYEQTRRDAQTKAVLLREQHHRVKNSLAGIVGLLSTADPDLSPAARRWLERVIERIGAMARAYDLFSGGVEHVGLAELVEQLLLSLSVIRPPGVVVRTEVRDGQLPLNTKQAVTLSMVLHELCSNALTHGLGESGTLTIQSFPTSRGIAIEVVDDGRGLDEHSLERDGDAADPDDAASFWHDWPSGRVTATASRRGLGLRLVRELVARELRGEFYLRRRNGGGTLARVEFPAALAAAQGASE